MWNLFKKKKTKDFVKTALSDETEKRVRMLFNSSEFHAVEELLMSKCGNNLYYEKNYNSEDLERVRFSVLKVSDGDFSKLKEAVELANLDVRDVMSLADFSSEVYSYRDWNP